MLFHAAPVAAQSAEAEALFEDGNRLMTDGKLAQACDAFEGSNRIEPRAGTLIRLGECREANHQLASAWSAYKDALTRVKDPRKRDIATAKVAELEPLLSRLTVSVAGAPPAGLVVTRNGKPVDLLTLGHALPVDGGDYVIAASAPGHSDWSVAITVPPDHGDLHVDVPALAQIATPAPEHPVAPAAPPPLFTPRRKIAVALASTSVATLIVGSVLGISAKGKESDAHALCPDPMTPCRDAAQATALQRAGHTRAIAANVLFGAAALTAIGAGVLWYVGRPETATHQVAVVPAFGPETAALAVVGWF